MKLNLYLCHITLKPINMKNKLLTVTKIILTSVGIAAIFFIYMNWLFNGKLF